MTYRPEIDGLRAVAVVAVVLYHANFAVARGGFVGVDVFFVISGYLITSIIVTDINRGRFSFLDFYERRVRRIVPALFAMVAAVSPVAAVLLLPGDLEDFGAGLSGVATFSSNVVFSNNLGYFDPAADLQPLLHTWSLAVEEQFYLVTPVLLTVAFRFGRRAAAVSVSMLLLASLAGAQWAVGTGSGKAFYLLQYRAWELMLGGLAAIMTQHRPAPFASSGANLLSLLGFAAICVAALTFDESTPFPGVVALVPTIGTLLVLLYGVEASLVHRILATRLFVGIGLISYSLYLWHQPLFAFARYGSVHEPTAGVKIGLVCLAVALAFLSWRFVEQPARRRSASADRAWEARPFVVMGLGSAFLVAAGVGLGINSDNTNAPNRGFQQACFAEVDLSVTCSQSGDTANTIVLLGDSYVMHLAPTFAGLFPDARFIQVAKDACSPILDFAQTIPQTAYTKAWAAACIDHNARAMEFIETLAPATVVIGTPFVNTAINVLVDRVGERLAGDPVDLTVQGISKTAERLKRAGHSVLVVQPPNNSGADLGRCVLLSQKFGHGTRCIFTEDDFSLRTQVANVVTERLAAEYHILNISDTFCNDGVCDPLQDGVSLFRDAGHLSVAGSAWIGAQLSPEQVARAVNRPSG